MSEHEIEKLLGGFAADALTPEEEQTLYTAALHDQELFNALADEQALKELLSDPDVRRRLLASLEQSRAPNAGGSLSWLDWFRRPAGLAWAGGLTAAALAVALGVRIYQDSLKQAAQSVSTEDAKPLSTPAPISPTPQPAAPQAVAPKAKAGEHVAPTIDVRGKGSFIDKPATPAQSAAAPSKDERTSDVAQVDLKKQTEQEDVHRETDTPVAALSARALFYGEEPGPADMRSAAKEQEQAMKPLAESPPQTSRLERKSERLIQSGKAVDAVARLKPLGLRYSVVVRGADGQEREVDAMTASKGTEPIFLTMEANQDAYLQVWKTGVSSTPQLQWPEKETGQVSLKLTAGQRLRLTLPMERETVTFTARLSRIPFGPIAGLDTAIFNRPTPSHIYESVAVHDQTRLHEQATYVVDQDPSAAAQITVEITVNR
jgi:hypothetical protein